MLNSSAFRVGEWQFTVGPGMFRLLLAVAVVITHTFPLKLGGAAVDLFFALSGYWVFQMWHNEYEKTSASYLTFITSRAWRLLPVYLMSVIFTIALAALFGSNVLAVSGGALEKLHFYFSNFFILGLTRLSNHDRMIDGAAWSLDLEVQFYLIAPLLILILKSRRLRPAFIAIAAMCIGSSIYLVFYQGDDAVHSYLPMYLIFFLIGLITANQDWRPSLLLTKLSLGLSILFIVAILLFHQTRPLLLEGRFTTKLSYYQTGAHFVLALLMLPYAMVTLRVDTKSRHGILSGLDRHFSNVTYEVYLFHGLALMILEHYFGHDRIHTLPYLPAAYAGIALFSTAVYIWFDQPIDALRRKFIKSRKQAHSNKYA